MTGSRRVLVSSSCGAVLAFALAATGAYAQGAPAAAAPAPPPDADAVQTVVVTAQRRDENIQSVPITIQAFTGKDVRDLGVKTTSDLGALTPNVDIALPGGAGNQPIITIRGIGLNDASTNNSGPNGVYLDEVYQSSPTAQTFQTFDLDRVEILKGPQGTLYGRNASGGALNLVTTKPTDYYTGDLHAEYGSYNTYQLEGGVGGPIAPGLNGRVAAVVNESDGYFKNLQTGGHENGANNFALRGALQWKPVDDLTVLFNVHGGRVDNRPNEYRHIGTNDPKTGDLCTVSQANGGGCVDLFGYGAFNRREHLTVNSAGAYLRADYKLGDVTLTSISAFEHNDKFHPEETDASADQLLELDGHARSDTATQEFRAAQTTERYNWQAGFYFLHEDLKQNQPGQILEGGDAVFGARGALDGVAFQSFNQNDQITDAYAVYGQGAYKLTPKLSLTLGGRVTREDKSFHYDGARALQQGGSGNFGPRMSLAVVDKALEDDNFSFRVAADYRFTDRVLGYASVTTGFKSGGFNGGFLSSTDPAVISRQLDPVRPETVTSYEVGVKSELFSRRLVFNAAYFYNDYSDEQVFELASPPPGSVGGLPVSVLGNAESAHTQGIDLQVQARPVRELTLGFNLGVLEAKLDRLISDVSSTSQDFSGNDLPLAPHLSLAAFVDYKRPLFGGVVDVQANANYRSRQFFDVANDPFLVQEGYWLANLRVAYKRDGAPWEVAVFARNLAGKQYYIDKFNLVDPFGLVQGIVGAPRTVGAEVNYRF